jgi:6-methylsalicylate decarboxylase
MRIDVHAHMWSNEYLDLMQRFGKTDTDAQRKLGAGNTDAEIQARFALMDAAGVQMQIISAPPQSPFFEDQASAVAAARLVNEQYRELVRRWPQRFRTFASLPLPHIDAALSELDRAFDDHGVVGVAINTAILGRSIADPRFAPLYEELNRRRSVLYVHPEGCGLRTALIRDHHMTWMVGAPLEDTVAIAHLIVYGIPSRYPDLKIICSHLGGAIPMLLQRMDDQVGWEMPSAPEKPSVAARRMWYDTVGHGHRPALRAAVETFGADRLVLGTDFPYESGELFKEAVRYIGNAGLTPADARQILDVTAATLLGLA